MIKDSVPDDVDERGLPRIDPNKGPYNLWYYYRETDTALVFVHGVLSNSRDCWLSNNGHYWPKLILQDPRLPPMAIYLGGYATNILSGDFGIRDCSDQLFQALRLEDKHGRPRVMHKKRLVFICHSLGGVVVRYLLESHWQDFQHKDVHLLLIASPSYGSKTANTLFLLTKYFRHRVGKQLQWGSETLQELDHRWKMLIDQKRIPRLVGIEACENYFPVPFLRVIPRLKRIVERESAARYFSDSRTLWNTDHFTIVKPDNLDHPAHLLLVERMTGRHGHYVLAEPPPAGTEDLSEEVRGKLERTADRVDQVLKECGEPLDGPMALCANLEAIRLIIKTHETLFIKLVGRLSEERAVSNGEYQRACGQAIKFYLEARIITPKFVTCVGALQSFIGQRWVRQREDLRADVEELTGALAAFQEELGKDGWTGLGAGREGEWNLQTLVERALNYEYGGGKVDAPIHEIASRVLRNNSWRRTNQILQLIERARISAVHVQDE